MSFRLKLRHGFTAAILLSVFSFQNCSTPMEEDFATDLNSGAYKFNLPHAYEAKVDTIAHMSCSNIATNLPRRAYFTYRVGAYNSTSGGLTLSARFREATKFFSTRERAEALSQSGANANTRLNLAIRSQANMDAILKEGSLVVGEEIESLLPPLDSPEIAGPLAGLAPGAMMNYFPSSGSQRLMEASLRFYRAEASVKDSRNRLAAGASDSAALLTVGFSDSSDEGNQVLRKPMAGKGYRLQFSLPYGYSMGEARVIAGIAEERDLATNQNQAGMWDCSANYQFMVVRPEDKANGRVICNAYVDRSDNMNEEAALRALRRVLRVEDWYVDIKNHCVMPRGTGDYCYGNMEGQTVQYGTAYCGGTPGAVCPHFVSVCIRR